MKKIAALAAILAFGFASTVFAADNPPPHPEKYPAHHQDGKNHHDGKKPLPPEHH